VSSVQFDRGLVGVSLLFFWWFWYIEMCMWWCVRDAWLAWGRGRANPYRTRLVNLSIACDA